MNLLLLTDSDFIGEDLVEISGRRHEHIVNILKLPVGGTVKAGLINGKTGIGK